MRANGAVPCTYTADIGQYDEPDIDGVPDRALEYGAEIARAVDCRTPLVEEGLAALACGAFHIRSGGRTYFNTTPLGRAVTGTMLVRAMHEDGVDIWGDGSTFKGNDIERFYRYGLLANPELRIYKPWLDADFVHELGGRAEMSQWLIEHGLPYRDSQEKAYSTDANIWGATHEAKTLEHLDVSLETVEPIMGVQFWDPAVEIAPEDVTVRFQQGRPVAINGDDVRRPRRARARGQRRRRPARPGHVRPDREPHHRGQVARHLRGARAWRCSSSPTSGCSTPSTTRTRSRTTTREGRRLGRLLYEGRWLDPQSLMLRESMQRWVASVVTGEVTLRLRRGDDYTVLARRARIVLPPRQAVDGAHRATRPSARPTGSASSPCATSTSPTRAELELYAAQPLDQGQVLVEHGILLVELTAGGGDRITANPARRSRTDDEALDRAAMEFGTH